MRPNVTLYVTLPVVAALLGSVFTLAAGLGIGMAFAVYVATGCISLVGIFLAILVIDARIPSSTAPTPSDPGLAAKAPVPSESGSG